VALGTEPVRIVDEAGMAGPVVSRVTSGGLGYTLGVSIAFAYLPVEHSAVGTRVEVGIFGQQIGAVVTKDPLYDPTSARVRA
jgi:4-methylaminobutanoate oxidase (formaldehyde-forming)